MPSATLLDLPRQAVWHLLDRLDADPDFDFQIVAAFWRYEEEREDWRLYLASPRVGSDGPLALYRQIQPILDTMPPEQREDLETRDLSLVCPDALEVREMKRRFGSVADRRDAAIRRRDLASREEFIYRLSGSDEKDMGMGMYQQHGDSKAAARRQTEAQGWKLVWSDEFEYRGLPDPKKWDYEQGLVRNNELQFYTKGRAENARVENGALVIKARREAFRGAAYTAASLVTLGRFAVQFGRVEMRAKLPGARGTWPAFWMMGEDIEQVGWPRCGEIDIMEHVGHNPGVVHANVHQIGDDGKHWSKGEQIVVPDCVSAFHVYAVEWRPDRMDFFVDEKKYLTFPYQGPGKWTFDRRFYLLLNLAIGGAWGGQKGVDESAFPQKYVVEYVRVFQRARA